MTKTDYIQKKEVMALVSDIHGFCRNDVLHDLLQRIDALETAQIEDDFKDMSQSIPCPVWYRGNLLSSHEWVEGFLVQSPRGCATYIGNTGEWREINPTTVEPFTGIIDIHKVKIFMNDIVRCNNYHGTVEGIVRWHKHGFYYLSCVSGFSDEPLFNCWNFEVIGNKH